MRSAYVQKIIIFAFFFILVGIVLWLEISSPHNTPSQPYFQSQSVPIVQVFDGDTFSANINGAIKKVRILGIDTPEVSGGYKEGECFGKNASAFAKQILLQQSVVLVPSKIGDQVDPYGRLLRYAHINGEDFGAMLMREGYAESYKKFPHDRKTEYNALEQEAKSAKKGLWGKCK